MDTYNYTGYYRDITVEQELGTEGILSGEYGNLHFKRCNDGFAIIDSSFLGSGFVPWPCSADIGFPDFINGIPVTEIHQTISIDSTLPITIEAGELKRAYLKISRTSINQQIEDAGDAFRALFLMMLRDQNNVNQKDNFLELSIVFCKNDSAIDYCEIRCDEKCILHGIATKHLKVNASTVVLKDKAYSGLEQAYFSGRVYPFIYSGWDGDEPNIDYFSGAQKLKILDGSLRGDNCWQFNDCTSLEKVHLSNGILRVLPKSFENCISLVDLYIPDTVTEIGAYAFSGCKNLRTIHLPANIRRISKGMFFGCTSLTKCFLSDDIEFIDDEAFSGCIAMKKPWIPKNIKRISESAFDNPDWSRV